MIDFYKGTEGNLPTERNSESIYVTEDSGKMWIGERRIGVPLEEGLSSGSIQQEGCISGCLGFYWTSIDFDNNTLTLSTALNEFGVEQEFDITEYWSVGDIVSITNDQRYDNCSSIIELSGKTIKVDALPFTEIVDDGTHWSSQYVIVMLKPDRGVVDFAPFAISLGENNNATNWAAVAIGRNNNAYGQYSVAIGRNNSAGYASLVSGRNNQALSDNNFIGGYNNTSHHYRNVISGGWNTTYGAYSLLAGQNNTNGGTKDGSDQLYTPGHSAVLGYGNQNYAGASLVTGDTNINEGARSCIIGHQNNNAAGGALSFVAGGYNQNKCEASIVAGARAYNEGASSLVIGSITQSGSDSYHTFNYSSASVVIGSHLENKGTHSQVFGTHNTNSNGYSAIFGSYNSNVSEVSLVSGTLNTNQGSRSLVTGDKNTNTGRAAIVFGDSNSNSGKDSLVGGDSNSNNGVNSQIIGSGITNFSSYSLLSGTNLFCGNTSGTTGHNSLVVGSWNTVSTIDGDTRTLDCATVIGRGNNVKCGASVFVGGSYNTRSQGDHSHLSGWCSTGNSTGSFVHGNECQDAAEWQTVFGKFNAPHTAALFQIGNGTKDARSNAFEVNSDGTAYIGGMTIGYSRFPESGEYWIPATMAEMTFDLPNGLYLVRSCETEDLFNSPTGSNFYHWVDIYPGQHSKCDDLYFFTDTQNPAQTVIGRNTGNKSVQFTLYKLFSF